jgi:FtsP/CotA-like multicopper oxidase with cupredoxin domain
MNNGETLTTRAYRQEGTNYTIPGPTIKMVPGNKYVLKFHNTLPYEPLNPSHNVYKDPNASNIHTHGLHISGQSPGDDVTRVFEGGRGGDFVWDIPSDHMGGTYWYHAHHHGSTFLQVSGGMFGMMIVDDSNDGIPAPVAAMEERQFVFGYLDMGAAGTGGDILLGGSLSSTWTTNGIIGGDICIPPNTWQHWRVAIADRGAMLRDLSFGPECEVMVLARDGVWRTVAPKELTTNSLILTGASRADFAIRTSANSTIQMGGNTIANIIVNGTEDIGPGPYDENGMPWEAIRPDYLRDLRSEVNVNTESVSMGARTVNGSKFDHLEPTFTLPATQVQEWSLSGNVRHPFHLHIYHVQALEDDRDFEAGEYYDVVASQMSVRFDLNTATSTPYEGRTIMHCHVLAHEDQGAMGWLKVEGGQGAPTFPLDDNGVPLYSEYYTLGGSQQPPAAPNNLIATAISSSSIDLNWDDNSSDEDGFNIERSTDGSNFSFLVSVGADGTSYSDNGLAASTTYYYRVSAYNASGSSSVSNTASATTLPGGGGGIDMHVSDIAVTRNALNGNRFSGVASVTIVDQNGTAVSGATVDGSFSGPNSSNESGVTDASGQVTFNSRAVKNPAGDWCFEVTNVSKTGDTYDSGANVETIDCENSGARSAAANLNDNIKANPELLGAFPNPFNDHTNIAFSLDNPAEISLEVYTIMGERVALMRSRNYAAGHHMLRWDTDHVAAGTYYAILKKGNEIAGRHKLMLVR